MSIKRACELLYEYKNCLIQPLTKSEKDLLVDTFVALFDKTHDEFEEIYNRWLEKNHPESLK